MKTQIKKKSDLTERQIATLKVLKRAPKTTNNAFEALLKKRAPVTKQAVGACMRTLENRGLVRARTKFDKKLKRDVILWELTASGRKALGK